MRRPGGNSWVLESIRESLRRPGGLFLHHSLKACEGSSSLRAPGGRRKSNDGRAVSPQRNLAQEEYTTDQGARATFTIGPGNLKERVSPLTSLNRGLNLHSRRPGRRGIEVRAALRARLGGQWMGGNSCSSGPCYRQHCSKLLNGSSRGLRWGHHGQKP